MHREATLALDSEQTLNFSLIIHHGCLQPVTKRMDHLVTALTPALDGFTRFVVDRNKPCLRGWPLALLYYFGCFGHIQSGEKIGQDLLCLSESLLFVFLSTESHCLHQLRELILVRADHEHLGLGRHEGDAVEPVADVVESLCMQ